MAMRGTGLLACVAAALAAGAAFGVEGATTSSPEWGEKVVCGPLTLDIRVSRTAHLFHVVDQLSAWNEFCHTQYARAMPTDDEDRKALARHKAIRQRKGWGGGLEQAFYTPLGLDEAMAAGVKAGHLAEGEAAVEREVFRRFEARVDALLRAQSEDLRKSLTSLDRDSVASMAKSVARLVGVESLTLPVFLLASPPPGGGGGYNGGRLTLELCPGEDGAPTLVHEAVHAFLEKRRDALEKCAAATSGLDEGTLNEGIAYAVMPGIFSAGSEDRLAARVEQDLRAGRGLDDSYVRYNRFGLALRPVVREFLERGDLDGLLVQARAVWLGLREVEAARTNRRPCTFSAGPGWEALGERLRTLRAPRDYYSFRHDADNYRQRLTNLRKGDLLVLMFAGDDEQREVPAGWEDLLPASRDEIASALKRGSLEKAGTARGIRVVVLAAPTKQALAALIRETTALAE